MEKFRKYIVDELGLDESGVSDQRLMELYKALGTKNIGKLYSSEYRLLYADNFEEAYGLNSELVIKEIDCKHWFPIVMYKNIYR